MLTKDALVIRDQLSVLIEKTKSARCWWITPVIPATQEAEIRRITAQSSPGK
jgi:hypothetical protein